MHPELSLFCIPHAGGGASAYRRWADALQQIADVTVLQLAGREARFREPVLDDIGAVVDDLCAAVEARAGAPFAPFALFGHSFGGLLAFEVAYEIRRRTGQEPVRLFVSASAAPQARPANAPIADLPDDQFVATIDSRYGGIPAEILQDPDYLALFLAPLRADMRMLERYRCASRSQLTCPISVIAGSNDSVVLVSRLEGWSEHTVAEFTLDSVDGDHFYLQTRRLELAQLIQEKLKNDMALRRGIPAAVATRFVEA